MTEIPEHLLERSRARRAALGLGGGDSGAPSAAPSADAGEADAGEADAGEADASATPATTAATPARAAAPPPVAKPEIVLSPYAQAAIARKKIPFWAVPVLLFLPLWGFLYWGTLDPEPVETAGALAAGEEVYASCATCHGASGGGGAGPELATVTETFPDFQDHVWWVINGSTGVTKGQPYGSPDRPGGQRVSVGGMAPWGSELTAQELLEVVLYERAHFGGAPEAEAAVLEAIIENPDLPANFEPGMTLDEVRDALDELTPEDVAAEAAAAE